MHGHTTLARRFEADERAIRLTADEWLHDLYPEQSADELDTQRPVVERLQWAIAIRALQNGCNVLLDWGLWTKEERTRYRSAAQAVGARVVLLVLDPPREELLRRLTLRNSTRPTGTFDIEEEELDRALAWFERPTPAELALFDEPEPRQQ
jgi:predicted kinase